MKPVYYVFECGCRSTQKKTIQIKSKTSKWGKNLQVCIKHGKDGILIKRERECARCGDIFENTYSGGLVSEFCPECLSINDSERNKEFKVDDKRSYVACKFFGNLCGNVCIEPEFYCRQKR
jgi:hypothetical protein